MTTRRFSRDLRGWLLSSPYVLFTLVFFLIPLAWSIYLIFLNWNLISPVRQWVGLGNFVEALRSSAVLNAFLVSYKLMLIFVPGVLIASIAMAVIINNLPRFRPLFAVGFFLPYLSSGVVVALVVRGLLSFFGPVNTLLRQTVGTSPNWLGNPTLAVLVIAFMIIWKMAGYYALIFLAGLQSIASEMYEAASLDGAGSWTQFWSITLPQLYPALYTVLILSVGLMFAVFTEPYVLTNGGPQGATQTWQLEIFYQAFQAFRAGYAATIAVINAVVTFVSILIIRYVIESVGRHWGYETG
jgi:multiple sugar transport system permease protein